MKKINKIISSIGESNLRKRFYSKMMVGCPNGCWEWIGARTPKRYGYLMWNKTVIIASRISWFLSNGKIPEGKFVLHECDNPPCCNPHHLFLGTKKDNAQDALKKGRLHVPNGSEHWKTTFTEEDIRTIRKLRISGETFQAIAEKFGVTRTCIWAIWHGRVWGHVKS